MATAQATSQPSLGFPAKGSLKRLSFPRIVREVARAKLTGSLYLLSKQTKKVVFFEEGAPVFVRSNVLSECLGQILAEEGLITQEQCEQTLEAIRRTGKKQGELLVEMGLLSEANLRYGLEAQLRAKLFDIFSWEDGRYQFKAGAPAQTFRIRLDTSAEGVIVDAILDRYSEERATAALAPVLERYPVPRRSSKTLDLLPEENYFLRCIDGSKSFGELLRSPPHEGVPSPAALLYGLLQAAVVQVSDKPRAAKKVPKPPDLSPPNIADEELAPKFDAVVHVTEYEDTPLPGALPKERQQPLGEEPDFDEVESVISPASSVRGEMSQDLLQAEPASVDETFDDDIEFLDEEEAVELVDEDDLSEFDDDLNASTEHVASEALDFEEDLLDLEEIDGVDLGDGAADVAATDNPEVLGAIRFNEGEAAVAAGAYGDAVRLLESAYQNGFDVAELHAMLAYSRFMESDMDDEIAAHAFELLEYAEQMDPSLDLVHAYRGAIYRAMGEPSQARASLQKALDVNPYCELAMQLLDSLG